MPFTDLKTQYRALESALHGRIQRVLEHGQFILGPEVAELETALAGYTGARHCVTVANGTDALQIALLALGVGPGDEVITPAFSFVASAEAIVLAGAVPVFVDVEADTGNVDATKIGPAIGPRTRAILPVSLYGQPPDMQAISALAQAHGLAVVEDGAQSFGACYRDMRSGNLSTIGCTSFYPSKPLGCYGDGGALFTNDDALAEAARQLRDHGQSGRYLHTRIGLNSRMDSLQCAILLAKLERFPWELERRAALGRRYGELLDAAGVARIRQRRDRSSVFAQYTILADDRARVCALLQEAGIPSAIHYPLPLNRQPAYAHYPQTDGCPVAAELSARVLSLPMSADLAEPDQSRIVERVAGAVRDVRNKPPHRSGA
ncbi:MAG TPA: DegT/DnrJ/EryC1/StrS family aminotransferase [Noviherbaspirillum sp.]|nr:DegT/DnrJ/EryC1/StrS family aminotransferase [Noviherbaspirillum sp.]